jgi:hypothetical protein
MSTTLVPGQRRDPEALERSCGPLREARRELREDAIGHLDEQNPGGAGVDRAEVAAERVPRDLGDLARELDAGRAGADDDEGEPGRAAIQVRLVLGRLERGQDPAANLERALERLHVGRERPPLVVAEVRVVRAAGDDQAVVGKLEQLVVGRDAVDPDAPAVEVEAGDLAQDDADIPVALEDPAQRRGDLARRERAGRDLVHERLEEREVAPVDQRDVDRRPAQLPDGLHAAEPAADDDHVLAARLAARLLGHVSSHRLRLHAADRARIRRPLRLGPPPTRRRP